MGKFISYIKHLGIRSVFEGLNSLRGKFQKCPKHVSYTDSIAVITHPFMGVFFRFFGQGILEIFASFNGFWGRKERDL